MNCLRFRLCRGFTMSPRFKQKLFYNQKPPDDGRFLVCFLVYDYAKNSRLAEGLIMLIIMFRRDFIVCFYFNVLILFCKARWGYQGALHVVPTVSRLFLQYIIYFFEMSIFS